MFMSLPSEAATGQTASNASLWVFHLSSIALPLSSMQSSWCTWLHWRKSKPTVRCPCCWLEPVKWNTIYLFPSTNLCLQGLQNMSLFQGSVTMKTPFWRAYPRFFLLLCHSHNSISVLLCLVSLLLAMIGLHTQSLVLNIEVFILCLPIPIWGPCSQRPHSMHQILHSLPIWLSLEVLPRVCRNRPRGRHLIGHVSKPPCFSVPWQGSSCYTIASFRSPLLEPFSVGCGIDLSRPIMQTTKFFLTLMTLSSSFSTYLVLEEGSRSVAIQYLLIPFSCQNLITEVSVSQWCSLRM